MYSTQIAWPLVCLQKPGPLKAVVCAQAVLEAAYRAISVPATLIRHLIHYSSRPTTMPITQQAHATTSAASTPRLLQGPCWTKRNQANLSSKDCGMGCARGSETTTTHKLALPDAYVVKLALQLSAVSTRSQRAHQITPLTSWVLPRNKARDTTITLEPSLPSSIAPHHLQHKRCSVKPRAPLAMHTRMDPLLQCPVLCCEVRKHTRTGTLPAQHRPKPPLPHTPS